MKFILILATAAMALTAGVASADLALAQKSGCLSCHLVSKKVVGPAYDAVAKKYKGDAQARAHLVNVIRKGGKGVWGPMPMPAHPQVSEENANKLAGWILSL